MKITFVDEPNKIPSFIFEIENSKVEVFASTFIAALFEKMGMRYEQVLGEANRELALALFYREFELPDILRSSDEAELQRSLTKLNQYLLDQREIRANLNPR